MVNMSRIHKLFQDDKIFFIQFPIHWEKKNISPLLVIISQTCQSPSYKAVLLKGQEKTMLVKGVPLFTA